MSKPEPDDTPSIADLRPGQRVEVFVLGCWHRGRVDQVPSPPHTEDTLVRIAYVRWSADAADGEVQRTAVRIDRIRPPRNGASS